MSQDKVKSIHFSCLASFSLGGLPYQVFGAKQQCCCGSYDIYTNLGIYIPPREPFCLLARPLHTCIDIFAKNHKQYSEINKPNALLEFSTPGHIFKRTTLTMQLSVIILSVFAAFAAAQCDSAACAAIGGFCVGELCAINDP